jgi:hypothetical protein
MSSEIREAFRRILGKTENPIVVGTVISVSEDDSTCIVEPLNGDADIEEARYMADISGRTAFIPEIGSIVVVAMFSDTAGIIVGYSSVSEIRLNGYDKGGIPVAAGLLQKINQLESELNTLKSIFATWVPVPSDGGAALKTAITGWASGTIPTTGLSEIENDKVKHGTGS